MGQFIPEYVEITLEEQVKSLGNEELLDFWEESHSLGHMPGKDIIYLTAAKSYEQVILNELRMRFCHKSIPAVF